VLVRKVTGSNRVARARNVFLRVNISLNGMLKGNEKHLSMLFAPLAVILLIFSTMPGDFSNSMNITASETNVTSLVSGSEAYSYDVQLEHMALSHYAFHAAGSAGAKEAADWIADQFESFSLKAEKEEFQFTSWDLLAKPTLIIDDDGNVVTTDDQKTIESFQSTHYSLPGNIFADLIVLPLPSAANPDEVGATPIGTLWNVINTAGKVVLVGQEVRWNHAWEETYKNKLTAERPAAVVYTWWYDWMTFVPDFFSSAGGRPLSSLGAYYWDLQIPVGFVNYGDGLWIRNRESSMNVSAKVVIESINGTGAYYNVVGKLPGYEESDKFVIVSSHYDTVMCAGFCDNGAGTSGVIELAKVLSEAVIRGLYYPKFTIVFVAFTAEELGLVGSINYVMKHEAEMGNIVAVINLDCIGSDKLSASETNPTVGFDLDQIVLSAAGDLGIDAALIGPGGSDQEVFRNPAWGNNYYLEMWGLNANIDIVSPVESSTLLISFPLQYRDKWNMGTPGWIHTSYDNSTSTETLNWVEPDDLEDHIKVAALTIMRISPSILSTDLDKDGTVNIIDLNIVARAFGSYPGHPRWNETADLSKDGWVDIKDIYKVARDYGKTV